TKMPQNLCLSKIKADINNVIANLQCLEKLSTAPVEDFNIEHASQIQQRTTALLEQLEQLPHQEILRIQLRRQLKRIKAKENAKLRKEQCRKTPASVPESSNALTTTEEVGLSAKEQACPLRLKRLGEATMMLQKFDLLEKLYTSRGGHYGLSQSLAQMRKAWRCVQKENDNTDKLLLLETMWDRVIFGCTSGNICYQRKGKKAKKDFIQKRTIWDSYICQGTGTSIPIGWVLPPENPSPEW
ncbi:CG1896, partial [Drosophila busckii]